MKWFKLARGESREDAYEVARRNREQQQLAAEERGLARPCVQCKHHRLRDKPNPALTIFADDSRDECGVPASTYHGVDLVAGLRTERNVYVPCHAARSGYDGHCGTAGKHWEPKS